MLPKELIAIISNYCTHYNLKLLDKENYREIILVEQSNLWYDLYLNCFKNKTRKLLPLNQTSNSIFNLYSNLNGYNWKEEYMRIRNYNKWELFEIENLINLQTLDLSDKLINELPKEIGNLINLQN